MKKIIIVSTVGLIYDGITSVITSYLEAMNREDLKIYVVSTIMSESKIEKKIEELGCEIVQLPSRRKSPIVYFFSLAHFIRKNNIDVIHAHGNSATLSIELLAGFLGGCKRRIAHSHNTRCDQVRADKMLRPLFNLLYTDALACGNEAGLWLFGNRKFKVLKNGRNVKKYSFSLEKRNEMRKRLDISDCIAIGHVGGFFEQKNHKFLIKIFREVLNRKPNAKLFLIGDGPLKDEIMKNVGRNCTFGTNAEYHHGIVALRFEAPYPAGIDRLVAAVDELIVGGGPVDCAVSFFEFDQGLGYGLCSF